ncbi:hypothetical protein BpHYR1_035569 [Brachionus plicatilis]|uniref:Uncharacterized protein n=1 Tax=Brachionus plicatilis TaxID=10195 RepID=A0A3M7RUW8_BRAPC|nr:hypothetical protein BpHYR1_035569 [Brachionus plicatilis]
MTTNNNKLKNSFLGIKKLKTKNIEKNENKLRILTVNNEQKNMQKIGANKSKKKVALESSRLKTKTCCLHFKPCY